MANMKKTPAVGSEGGAAATSDGQGLDAFRELTGPPRWVPWHLVWNEQRGKFDKIPHDGKHGLSTKRPEQWMTQAQAQQIAERDDVDGIGLVMTGSIDEGEWRLVGLDFDGVDLDNFKLPFDTYSEKSPSGKGVRAFAWVPITWASKFMDSTDCRPPNCNHCEVYIGSSPRFLTVTFDKLNDYGIARLGDAELAALESWGLTKFEPDKPLQLPEGIGEPVNLTDYSLTPDQQQLVAGTGLLDRSRVFIGLAIKLIDRDVSLDDLLATIMATPALWAYCMSHRRDDQARALQFAMQEVGRAYLKSQTGMRANLHRFNGSSANVNPVTSTPSTTRTVAFPPPFPGPMAEAVAACLEVSRKPQPTLALGATLSVMAAACGSYFMHQDGGRLNLFILEVAKTGAGKDAALRFARHVGRSSKAKMVGKPASGQGLEDTLASNRATYCVVDEIAHFFSVMNGANAKSYEIANASIILELWSDGRDAHTRREKAGADSITIDHPAFNLLGFTTPEKLGNAFTPDDFADGLAGRILFVITDEDPKARRVKKPLSLPASFKKTLAEVDRGLMFVLVNGGVEIGLTDEADALIDVLLDEFDEQSRTTDSPYDRALCSRSMEKLERIAGVLAVWDSPAQPTITAEHLLWAAQFVRASNTGVLGFVDEYLHGGVEQDNAAKLLRMIKDGKTTPGSKSELAASKAGWTPRSALLRRAKMGADKEFDPAIRLLVKRGEIVEGKVGELLVLGVKGDE